MSGINFVKYRFPKKLTSKPDSRDQPSAKWQHGYYSIDNDKIRNGFAE